jgi:hypothetical protein
MCEQQRVTLFILQVAAAFASPAPPQSSAPAQRKGFLFLPAFDVSSSCIVNIHQRDAVLLAAIRLIQRYAGGPRSSELRSRPVTQPPQQQGMTSVVLFVFSFSGARHQLAQVPVITSSGPVAPSISSRFSLSIKQ